MHALARIGLVDYYGSVFTANDQIGSRKKQENLTMPAENVPPRPGTPTLQGPTPSTAPAGLILLKFWLKTRKSILNKVTKYQIPTSNRSGARIEKPPGGGGGGRICPRKE